MNQPSRTRAGSTRLGRCELTSSIVDFRRPARGIPRSDKTCVSRVHLVFCIPNATSLFPFLYIFLARMLPGPASAKISRGIGLPAMSRRHTRVLGILGAALFLFLWWPSPPLPRNFRTEWARWVQGSQADGRERRLPQHKKSLPMPEGRHGRHVRLDESRR